MNRLLNALGQTRVIFAAFLGMMVFPLTAYTQARDFDGMLRGHLLFLAGCLIFYLTYRGIRSERFRKVTEALWYVIVAYVLVVALDGLRQTFLFHVLRPRFWGYYPTSAAMFLTLVLPALLVLITQKPVNKPIKALYFLCSMVIAAAAVISYTRGAWLGIGIVFIAYLLWQRRYKLIAGILAAGMLAVWTQGGYLAKRLATLGAIGDPTNQSRVYIWKGAVKMIAAHPFGTGFHNFKLFYPEFILPGAWERVVPHAHNLFLAFAADAGILAALCFLLFLISCFAYIYRNYTFIANSYQRVMVLALACSLIATLIHGMVDYLFAYRGLGWIFMYELGYCLGFSSLNQKG